MNNKPIETIISCPKCQTKIDIKNIKEAVKQRLDQEFDYILENL